jgi:hypothetical protein
MKFESLKPGMTVWSLRRYGVGNTTMRSWGTYGVRIVEVHPEDQSVTASWNNNEPQRYSKRGWQKWKLNKPVLINTGFNTYRKATREEIKAMKQTTPVNPPTTPANEGAIPRH